MRIDWPDTIIDTKFGCKKRVDDLLDATNKKQTSNTRYSAIHKTRIFTSAVYCVHDNANWMKFL